MLDNNRHHMVFEGSPQLHHLKLLEPLISEGFSFSRVPKLSISNYNSNYFGIC